MRLSFSNMFTLLVYYCGRHSFQLLSQWVVLLSQSWFLGLLRNRLPSPPSQPGVRPGLVGSFLGCFLRKASRDSQIGFCLPNRAEIIISKCCYKDKDRFVITVISPFLVSVSLGWYLLLLDFGIKGRSGRGLTCSLALHCYRKLGCSEKWQPKERQGPTYSLYVGVEMPFRCGSNLP